MSNISLQNISKQYNYKAILNDISLSVQEGQRVAIIGKNGAGKSTLLKILSGELEPDEGSRILQGNLEIKHLIQKPHFKERQRIKEVILKSLGEITKTRKKLKKTPKTIQNSPDDKALFQKHSNPSAFKRPQKSLEFENKIQQILGTFALKKLENNFVNL